MAKQLEKIDPTDPVFVFAFICAFLGDFGFFLILPHYFLGAMAIAMVWHKIHGGLPKIILVLALAIPGPFLMVGIGLAIVAENKFIAFLIEQAAILGIAALSGGIGLVGEAGAVAGTATEVGVEAAEVGAEVTEDVASAAKTGGDLAAEGVDQAENATDRAKDIVDRAKRVGDRLDGGSGQSDEDRGDRQQNAAQERQEELALGSPKTAFEEAEEANLPTDIKATSARLAAEDDTGQDSQRKKGVAQMEKTFKKVQDIRPQNDALDKKAA